MTVAAVARGSDTAKPRRPRVFGTDPFRMPCTGPDGDNLAREFVASSVGLQITAEVTISGTFSDGSVDLTVSLTPVP